MTEATTQSTETTSLLFEPGQDEKAYLVCLEGQGDRKLFLINETVWNYLHRTEFPERNEDDASWREFTVPERVRQAFLGYGHSSRDGFPGFELTMGSPHNDRAIHLSNCVSSKGQFSSFRETMEYLEEHGVKLEDEWNGMVY